MKLDLIFTRPMKANNRTVFTVHAANGGTQVTWTSSGKNGVNRQTVWGHRQLRSDGRRAIRAGIGPSEIPRLPPLNY